ncbi:hypothetical protein POM88_034284 [Heracleum sosnowskyi]|uniref:Uncharacterized protein n=1 Tax=Heracleum sosnowskyi TaxID=360622 RepID=A0AAD8MCU2_9APIA|nr:hypothetical protein POM88_034284 [Heracleum sosnowskyi]
MHFDFCRFVANDGKMKLDGMFPSSLSSELEDSNVMSLLFRYLIVTKCEVVSPPLEAEFVDAVKNEDTRILLKPKQDLEVKSHMQGPDIILKPKQEIFTKSAPQIFHDQNGK